MKIIEGATYLTMAEAAKRWQVGVRQAYNIAEREEIQKFNILGIVHLRENDVEKALRPQPLNKNTESCEESQKASA